MVESYNEQTIQLLNESILQDEFNDAKQNEIAYSGKISGQEVLEYLLDGVDLGNAHILDVGSGQSYDLLCGRMKPKQWDVLEPSPERAKGAVEDIIGGWSENIECAPYKYGGIVCWGTFCFVRSVQETLVEFNRVLLKGGYLFMDVVEYSTMPLAQTVNSKSFVNFIKLFGFEMVNRKEFGPPHHKRVGFTFEKFEDFNCHRLRMPQVDDKGNINNFLISRDWFMR